MATSALGVAVLLVAAALPTGCGSDEPAVIDWNLAESHTMEDVDWPRPDLDTVELAPVDSVRVRLPGGKAFTSNGDVVHDVTLERDERQVITVQIDSHARTTEDAYDLAVRWSEEWNLPRKPLDAWYEKRLDGRKQGREDIGSTAFSTRHDMTVGPGGPIPSVQIRFSFDEEKPSLVSLQFEWPRERG